MNLLNGFLSEWLYGPFFDYESNNVLLDCVNNNSDYVKIIAFVFAISMAGLFVFYKLYDPIKNSRLQWIITILLIPILCYVACEQILLANNCILIQMGNFSGEVGAVDPSSFVMRINFITMFYSFIISVILSILVFRKFSVNSSNNPI
jgi:hypothetical protein